MKRDDSSSHGQPRRGSPYGFLRLAVAAILWFAAITKGYQVATEPILWPKWFAVLACQYEWILGLLLLAGIFPRLVRWATLATFVLFSAVSGYLAWKGAESCGCFGSLHFDPRITFVLDLSVTACLIGIKPSLHYSKQTWLTRKQTALFAVGAIVAAVGLGFMWQYQPARLADDGLILGEARQVALEPTDWLGKACPLIRLASLDAPLSQGNWAVLLHYRNCAGCKKLLAGWPNSVLQYAPGSKTAIISVLPATARNEELPAASSGTLVGHLPETHTWFVPSPTILCLENGLVKRVIVQGETYEINGTTPRSSLAAKPKNARKPQRTAAASAVLPQAPLAAGNKHDFGYVEPGSMHRVRFLVENPSDHDWAVRAVRSDCDCVRCSEAPKAILAGKSVQITVELKAPNAPQNYSKQIVVFTDSKQRPTCAYRIEAQIGLPLRVVPSKIDFGQIKAEGECRQIVTVCNDGKVPVKLLYATCTDSACFMQIPAAAVAAGGRVDLPVILLPAKRLSTILHLEIQIHTSCPCQNALILAVQWGCQPGVVAKKK